MNHAFIIQVHAYPEQFGDIIRELNAKNHYFFINVDRKSDDTPFRRFVENLQNVYFLEGNERISVNHAGFSQIKCTLNLLKKAQSIGVDIDYFHSISGQDYPVVNNSVFDSFFETNIGKSYMHFDSTEERKRWLKKKYPDRYRKYHFIDKRLSLENYNLFQILFYKIIEKVQDKIYLRKKIPNLYAGWSWFTWHKSVVTFIMKFINEHPEYLRRFHNTSCCDELIFHTLLYDKIELLNIEQYNCLRFIEWHPKRKYSGGLPLILEEFEYNEIINSGAFFCRKVEPEKSKKLIELLKNTFQ